MNIRLHKNATTPARRAYIQSSPLPVAALAQELSAPEDTVRRWKRRNTVEDPPHTAHRLQTTLSPAQEAIVVALRQRLMLPLDDLLVFVREFIHPSVLRSGIDRCLGRHGVGSLEALRPVAGKPAHSPFKVYEPGFVHVDVKYLPQRADETARRDRFVAIDRATRWVFIQIKANKIAAAAKTCLTALPKACPTDNGKAFTDRLFGSREPGASGNHAFDQLCAALGIEHRLTPPVARKPMAGWSASMVESPKFWPPIASTAPKT